MSSDIPLLDRLVHDLKGPLAPLQTAAYLLGRDDLPVERRRELLDTIERQSRRLGQMIDEAGDWARASQGRLVGRRSECDLEMLIHTVIGGIPGCTIVPLIPAELVGVVVRGDETRLVQMLTAIVRHGCARDTARMPELVVGTLPGAVRITVSDTGPDLAPALSPGLLDQPLAEPPEDGLGMRLMIAQVIAQAHGGSLTAMPGNAGSGLSMVCELPLDGAPD